LGYGSLLAISRATCTIRGMIVLTIV